MASCIAALGRVRPWRVRRWRTTCPVIVATLIAATLVTNMSCLLPWALAAQAQLAAAGDLTKVAGMAGAPMGSAAHPQALAPFSVLVLDQFGQPAPNAHVTARHGQTYAIIAQEYTESNGVAELLLDRTQWYVVVVGRRENGTDEMWWYGYIVPQDWSGMAGKAIQRKEPWIDAVYLPAGPWPLNRLGEIVVVLDQGYKDISYQLHVRVTLWVDDDGVAPYAYELVSDYQNLYDGPLEPFHLGYTPTVSGHQLVRLLVERRFEDSVHGALPWTGADEGGWSWALDVAAPTPTASPSPTQTPRPTSTPSPTPSPSPTVCACAISGTVYADLDRDGLRGVADVPLSGVQVVATNLGGQGLAEGRSDSLGRYAFEGLPCDRYLVRLGEMGDSTQYLADASAMPPYRVSCEHGQHYKGIDWALPIWQLGVPLILASH